MSGHFGLAQPRSGMSRHLWRARSHFWGARPRSGRARLGIGLVTIVSLAVVGNPSAAEAQLSYGLTVGPQSEQSAELAAPTGLTTSTPSCASSTYRTAVPLG